MSTILTIIGTALLLNSAYLFAFSNFNLGLLLVLLAGLFFFLWGIFFEKVRKITKKGIGKALKIIVPAALFLELSLISFLAVYGTLDNVSYTEDAVIVLGAGVRGERVGNVLALRLECALDYFRENPDVKIVVTGGQGPQEDVTEAYAMEKYLVARGVPSENIIKEEMSTSTAENMAFAKEYLDESLEEGYSVAVITNGFHIFRTTRIAKDAGFEDVTHLHASLPPASLISCYLRETVGVIMMLFRR